MLWWILDPRRVELFQNVGERAQIPVEALKVPDVVLRDYSLRPIPIGACVELELEWQGRSVTTKCTFARTWGIEESHVFWELMW